MSQPTLRQLSFLTAIAEHGSFVAAAEQALVTQPSLSAAIKELEAILGTKLIERGRTGATLTPAGEIAAVKARAILSAVDELSEAVQGAAEPLTGPFRLGVIPTIAPFFLPRALSKAKAAFPRLKLYLREDLTSRLIEGLRAHTLDAALIALPYEAQGIDTMALFDDEFLFVGPPDHPLSTKSELRPSDLEGEPVLLLEDGHCLRDHAIGVCGMTRPGQEEVRATSLFTLVQMAAGGLGISLLPKIAAEAGIPSEGLVVRPFTPPVIGRQIGLAWRRSSGRLIEIKALAGILKSA
ncbi:hydrogen peroxide-inducible genes activator [Candidatus Phycosocius bacilliformis]|uniref:Hydrogen peroxide-inducible genes activator n=1 Tax=Candidatus Phycosocius bacilliformis TaxID=1445552 RepID=A0A2P2E6W8_9PROT|nr:hydrogen peroxide-inducible genes activator [Candidatus Phycosocius bacilliformis]GBF56797.1 hydrogen peroxide-inducible genes activator [Candidatus Phycosocius bacilliformis]